MEEPDAMNAELQVHFETLGIDLKGQGASVDSKRIPGHQDGSTMTIQ